ncbi:hypothetical protein BaRGS_00019208 [Batillaria attramentaria]|uniref:Uncharacterized protein n=1 Tax=Batillaria attramentaria TaxID=370345 RepID=A0ABD0KQX7_9CAEN
MWIQVTLGTETVSIVEGAGGGVASHRFLSCRFHKQILSDNNTAQATINPHVTTWQSQAISVPCQILNRSDHTTNGHTHTHSLNKTHC